MAKIPGDLHYTKDHEWVRKNDKNAVIGITDFAQTSLGDVTFVQLPEIGKEFKRGDILGTVESVKAVSDIYAPISGKVSKVNSALLTDPSVLNTDPYGNAWLVELDLGGADDSAELNELLTAEKYRQHAE